MITDDLRGLLAGPELVVVDLLVHALAILRLALVAEHPRLRDYLDAFDDPPLRRRARALLQRGYRFQRFGVPPGVPLTRSLATTSRSDAARPAANGSGGPSMNVTTLK